MIGSLFQPPSSWWFSTVDYDHPPMAVSAESNPATIRPRGRRESLHVLVLYVLALVREFRWTLLALLAAVSFGTTVFAVTTVDSSRPSFALSVYGAWMALLAQPIYNPPPTVPTAIVCAVYPLVGAVVIGEGVVRLAMLMMSRRRREKEWVRVMASTYRDHIVICGLGHLGVRVVEQLVSAGADVIVLERRRSARFVPRAQELNVPVLIRDMKEDQALIDAGIAYARSIIICTNDPIANLEVALDAKRMNPAIRVIMRMFDEVVAHKISDAMDVDVAFSSSSLAAPVVAAMALERSKPAPASERTN